MSELVLQFFGSFGARLGDLRLTHFRTGKVQALLIYLAVEPPAAHAREQLMELLWPGLPEDSARTNLRQIVYQLRKQIPEVDGVELVVAERNTIQRNPLAAVAVDATHFAKLIARVRKHSHSDVLACADCRGWLEQATALYQGAFLADFYLDDSNDFEDWARDHREVYRRQMLDALSTLANMNLRQGDYRQAQTLARRLLQNDELDERAYRYLMEALARNGQRQEALAVYDEASRLLRVELGMMPSNQTAKLAELIRADSLEVVVPKPAAVRGYKLLDEIGAGALGVVHRAYQPVVGREVAIKVIRPRFANNPDFIRRFESEAQTVARLEHPHIVPLYDYWREPDNAYLVMRWLRGGSLEHRLAGAPLPIEAVATVVDQIAAALQAAHRQHIIHRDVKAANILLDEDGNAYLSDFSVAKDLLTDEVPLDLSSSPETISPEQLLKEELSPMTDQYSLGVVIYNMLTGRPPIPPDSPISELRHYILTQSLPSVAAQIPGLPQAVDDVLRRATAKKPGDRFPDMISMARAFQRAAGMTGAAIAQPASASAVEAEAAVIVNPYKGLRAFQESDAGTFFGRKALVERLGRRLDSANGTDTRFLAVVGPSGSGKSSAVKAGLLPALRAGIIAGSANWFITEMTPGQRPLEELETALLRVAVDPPAGLLEALEYDERGLIRVLERILPGDGNGATPQLLLVIDQLEELYTLTPDDETRQQFIDSLLAALEEPDSRLRVVATLRADFYDRPLQAARLGELLRQNTEVVLPLTPGELEAAVTQPAALAGVRLEPGLLTAIAADVTDQPGTLPLMQYALTELFEQRANGAMTNDAYRAIGGVSGALGRRASEIYDSLDAAGQAAAKQMFLRLVTLGEGVEDTRRRALRAELEAMDMPEADIAQVVDTFGQYRLLSFDRDPATRGPTVEVAHEALLREWDLLRGWLDESRADVRMQRLLANEAAAWQAAGADDSYLLRGARLEQYDGWVESAGVSLTAEEQAYLTASLAARDQSWDEEEARRQRELDAQRERAEEQVAAAAALRRRATLLAVMLGVAAILALAAVTFARSSNANATIAATRAAEANANAALAVDNANLASTRQAEAINNAHLAATRESEAAAEADFRATAEASAAEQRDVAVSREREALESYSLSLAANARQALEADDQPLALLLALAANTVDKPPLESWRTLLDVAYAPGAAQELDIGSPVTSVDVSPDGRTLVTGSEDGLIRLWDINSGDLLATLAGHDNAVAQVVFSPDGSRLLSGGWDSVAILWNAATGVIEQELIGHGNPVRSVAFMPDGRQAITGEDSGQLQGEIIHWDLDSGVILNRFGSDLEEVIEGVLSLDVSPDGRLAVVGYGKGSSFDTETAAVWDIQTGELLNFLAGSEQSVNGVAISPDGHFAYGGSADSNVYVWELNTGQVVKVLRGHESIVTRVTPSPDGLSLLSGTLDGEMILWDLAAEQPIERFQDHRDAVWGLSYQGNSRAISGSADGTVREWDLTGQWRQAQWRDPDGPADQRIQELQISPDGRMVLAESWERETGLNPILTLWNYDSGTPLRQLAPIESLISDIAFTPDSQQAVTIHNDGMLAVWDLATGRRVQHFSSHAGYGSAVDVSSDGRYVISAGIDDQVIYQDIATGEIIQRMTGHFEGRGILDVVFLPGDRQAVSSSWDGTLIVWDLATGEQIRRLTGLEGSVGGHLFASGVSGPAVNQIVPVGNHHVLSTGFDRTLLLWDAATGESVMRLTGHSHPVTAVGRTPDGRYALSGAEDDQMILWDMTTGQAIRRFPFRRFQGSGFAPVIAVHPSGQSALTDDIDGSIIKWHLAEPDTSELIDWIASNRALRELTCLERETFQVEPLCVADQPASTTTDMLATARRAVSSLETAPTNSLIEVAGSQAQEMSTPERTPRVAVLGDNRGELQRGNFDVWLYEGQAGEVISLKMIADKPPTDRTMPLDKQHDAGVLDTRLYVINPDGTILQRIDDEITPDLRQLPDANLVAVKLPVHGQYRIEARSKLDYLAGGYTLHIERREAIGGAEQFADYVGHYVEGPWQYDTFIYLDGDRLMQSFDYTGIDGFENVAISETEFISAGDSTLTVFSFDEDGNVDGYAILASLIHPVAGQWYYAERVGDLPPEFLEALHANRP